MYKTGLLLYNSGVKIIGICIFIVSYFNEKAKKWIEGRKDIFTHMEQAFAGNTSPVLWFHCASLGEFEQGRPLIERFKNQHPEYRILLTFFSPSGCEVRKDYEQADWVFYLPMDTAGNAMRFVSITKPSMAFFIKYEFWHHYLQTLNRNKIPVYSISAIFRPGQVYFKPYGIFFRSILQNFDMIFTQNEQSTELLKTINISSLQTGDTRFDRVKAICDNKQEVKIVKRFKSVNRLLVIGSSWEKDMDILVSSINSFYLYKGSIGYVKTIIAPHEIDPKKIAALSARFTRSVVLFSEAGKKDLSLYDIMIIDNVGMLSSIYSYADFAYVGGAFGKGLHNILEPATFGMPLFFGPKYDKFKEACDLVNAGAAFPVATKEAFTEKFFAIAEDEEKRNFCIQTTRNYVLSNTGATEAIYSFVQSKLPV